MPCDYDRYPPNWKTEIRPRIMERAGERRDAQGNITQQACCEKCRVPNAAEIYRPDKGKADWVLKPENKRTAAELAFGGVKFTKIVLTVAHLDHDSQNHDVQDDRLQALCQRCHLLLDLPHHINNRKYGRYWKDDQTKLDF